MIEFPDIRVDQFRRIPGQRPPLACFLSHMHSDHLSGLENLKAPLCVAPSPTILGTFLISFVIACTAPPPPRRS
jgi:glyoxylase-like metal-dependent hydrolase (beta-lactamase superfamily II)